MRRMKVGALFTSTFLGLVIVVTMVIDSAKAENVTRMADNTTTNNNNNNNNNLTTTITTTQRTLAPSCNGKLNLKKAVVCYYTGQSTAPDKLDPCACTHLVLTGWTVDEDLRLTNPNNPANLSFVDRLKDENSALVILLSVHLDTKTGNGSDSAILTNLIEGVDNFTSNVLYFLEENDRRVDGLELDIAMADVEHRDQHIFLLKTLRTAFDNATSTASGNATTEDDRKYLLATTISTNPEVIVRSYDLTYISRLVDYAFLPAYNFTLDEATSVFHHSRLMGISDMINADSMVDLLVSLGLNEEKLVLGVPAFGVAFTLLNANETSIRSKTTGKVTRIVPYKQVCHHIESDEGWTVERDEDQTGVRAFKGTAWIGYDDSLSVRIKSKYVLLRNLAGVGLWSLDDDDPTGRCGRRFPLVSAARDTLASLGGANQKTVMESMEEDLDAATPSTTSTTPTTTSSSNDTAKFTTNVLQTSSLFSNSSTSTSSNTSSLEESNVTNVTVREKRSSVYRVTQIVDRSGAIHYLGRGERSHLECTRQGYYRHPHDCGRFYRCVKFNQYKEEFTVFEYDCPSGLVFDERHSVCNWPSAAPPCDGSGEIFSVPSSTFVCYAPGYFRDPQNCRWFYKCTDFYGDGALVAFEFRCPYDLVFDERRLLCNWRWLTTPCNDGVRYSAGIHHGRSGPYSEAYAAAQQGGDANYRPSFGVRPVYGVSSGGDFQQVVGQDAGNHYGSGQVRQPDSGFSVTVPSVHTTKFLGPLEITGISVNTNTYSIPVAQPETYQSYSGQQRFPEVPQSGTYVTKPAREGASGSGLTYYVQQNLPSTFYGQGETQTTANIPPGHVQFAGQAQSYNRPSSGGHAYTTFTTPAVQRFTVHQSGQSSISDYGQSKVPVFSLTQQTPSYGQASSRNYEYGQTTPAIQFIQQVTGNRYGQTASGIGLGMVNSNYAPAVTSNSYGQDSRYGNNYGQDVSGNLNGQNIHGNVQSVFIENFSQSTPSSNYQQKVSGYGKTKDRNYYGPSTPSSNYYGPSTPSSNYQQKVSGYGKTKDSNYYGPSTSSSNYYGPSTPSSNYQQEVSGYGKATESNYYGPSTPSSIYRQEVSSHGKVAVSNNYGPSTTSSIYRQEVSDYGKASDNRYYGSSTPSTVYQQGVSSHGKVAVGNNYGPSTPSSIYRQEVSGYGKASDSSFYGPSTPSSNYQQGVSSHGKVAVGNTYGPSTPSSIYRQEVSEHGKATVSNTYGPSSPSSIYRQQVSDYGKATDNNNYGHGKQAVSNNYGPSTLSSNYYGPSTPSSIYRQEVSGYGKAVASNTYGPSTPSSNYQQEVSSHGKAAKVNNYRPSAPSSSYQQDVSGYEKIAISNAYGPSTPVSTYQHEVSGYRKTSVGSGYGPSTSRSRYNQDVSGYGNAAVSTGGTYQQKVSGYGIATVDTGYGSSTPSSNYQQKVSGYGIAAVSSGYGPLTPDSSYQQKLSGYGKASVGSGYGPSTSLNSYKEDVSGNANAAVSSGYGPSTYASIGLQKVSGYGKEVNSGYGPSTSHNSYKQEVAGYGNAAIGTGYGLSTPSSVYKQEVSGYGKTSVSTGYGPSTPGSIYKQEVSGYGKAASSSGHGSSKAEGSYQQDVYGNDYSQAPKYGQTVPVNQYYQSVTSNNYGQLIPGKIDNSYAGPGTQHSYSITLGGDEYKPTQSINKYGHTVSDGGYSQAVSGSGYSSHGQSKVTQSYGQTASRQPVRYVTQNDYGQISIGQNIRKTSYEQKQAGQSGQSGQYSIAVGGGGGSSYQEGRVYQPVTSIPVTLQSPVSTIKDIFYSTTPSPVNYNVQVGDTGHSLHSSTYRTHSAPAQSYGSGIQVVTSGESGYSSQQNGQSAGVADQSGGEYYGGSTLPNFGISTTSPRPSTYYGPSTLRSFTVTLPQVTRYESSTVTPTTYAPHKAANRGRYGSSGDFSYTSYFSSGHHGQTSLVTPSIVSEHNRQPARYQSYGIDSGRMSYDNGQYYSSVPPTSYTARPIYGIRNDGNYQDQGEDSGESQEVDGQSKGDGDSGHLSFNGHGQYYSGNNRYLGESKVGVMQPGAQHVYRGSVKFLQGNSKSGSGANRQGGTTYSVSYDTSIERQRHRNGPYATRTQSSYGIGANGDGQYDVKVESSGVDGKGYSSSSSSSSSGTSGHQAGSSGQLSSGDSYRVRGSGDSSSNGGYLGSVTGHAGRGSGYGSSSSSSDGQLEGSGGQLQSGAGYRVSGGSGSGTGYGASGGSGSGAGYGASGGSGSSAGYGASGGSGREAGFGASGGSGSGASYGASGGSGTGASYGASGGSGSEAGYGASHGSGSGAGYGASRGSGSVAGYGASGDSSSRAGHGASSGSGSGASYGVSGSSVSGANYGASGGSGSGAGYGVGGSSGSSAGYGASSGGHFGSVTGNAGRGSGYGSSSSSSSIKASSSQSGNGSGYGVRDSESGSGSDGDGYDSRRGQSSGRGGSGGGAVTSHKVVLSSVPETRPSGSQSGHATYVGPIQCERAGLFRHPDDCNKFYECYWDKWVNGFTLHYFDCPVRLVYDDTISGCSWPGTGPVCNARSNRYTRKT